MTEEVFTAAELCTITGLSPRTVDGYLAKQKVNRIGKRGRYYLYDLEALNKLKELHSKKSPLTLRQRVTLLEGEVEILKEQQRDK